MVVSDFRCCGVSPAQQVSFSGRKKPVNVADLSNKMAAKAGPDATDLPEHSISAMTGQPVIDHHAE
jgi:hypothetical protein